MNSSWVPSHVQITVHQARDLLLKNKNGHSELYVCLQVEREKIVTSHLPRQPTPAWNHTTDFPLMSLDTTVQLIVRQKGRVSDNFIGCLAVPLRGFTISSKPVTHWYKLGAKPGKTNTKLRGEVLVTIKFLSKWLSSTSSCDSEVIVANGDVSPRSGRMLKRSKSDQKLKSSSSLLENPQSPQLMQSKIKEKLSAFRRSFRKKNKSPVLDQCMDDFDSFCSPSQSPAMTPEFRKRSQTLDLGKRSGSPSFRHALNCRSRSDSDHSEGSQSPSSMKPSAQSLFAEVAALENGVCVEGDLPSEENGGSQQSGENPVSPAMKFHNFRRKKRPWSMHQLPLPPTPTRNALPSPSEEIEPNKNTTRNPISSGGGSGSTSGSGSSQPDSSTEDGLGVITYRARSNSLSRSSNIRLRPQSYSQSMNDSQQSVRSFTEQESNCESCSEITAPVCSPPTGHKVRETISEGHSNPVPGEQNNEGESRLSPLGENGSAPSSSEPGRSNVLRTKRVRGSGQSKGEGSRRVVSPVSSKSASKQRPRPRLLGFGSDISGGAGVTSGPTTALHNGKGGRSSNAAAQRSTSSKPIALNMTSPPSVDDRLSMNVNEGKERVRLREQVSKAKGGRRVVSRRNTFAGNNLPSYRHEDPKSGIANVRESLIGDSSPRSRRSMPNSQPANYQKSPASQRQHKAPTMQKDPSQDGGDPPSDSELSPLLDIRTPKQSLSDRGSASPPLKPSNDIVIRDTPSRSEESPRSATVSRNNFTPTLSSSVEQVEGSDRQASRATLPQRIKHTVAYKESSPLAKKSKEAFQPLSLHPPSFTDYRSQTLPTRGKLNRLQSSDAGRPLSFTLTSETEAQVSGTDYNKPPPKRSPENIKLVKRGSMHFAGSPSTSVDTRTAAGQASPSVKKEPSTQVHPGTQVHRSPNPSHDDTDGATTLSSNGRHSTAPPSLTRAQSAAPAPTSKLSVSPGKIVAGAMHNRKPSGGLKKAMSMYQENKRQLTKVQREKSASPGNGYGMHGAGGPEKQWLHVSQLDARVTVSAGNSPTLQRRSTYMETLWRKNPFSTLRRTKSHLSPTAPNTRPLSMGDLDALTSDIQGAGFIKSQSAQLTPLPNVARSGHGTTQGVSDSVQSTVEPRWTYSVADCNSTVTLTPQTTCMPHSSSTHSEGRNTLPRPSSPLSDSSSISTLTKSDTNLGQRWPSDPPNPVGANYGHQTCSSVESEGFGSYTSEELTLDDLIHQDWGQWAKEDLVKELIHTKQRLSSAEDDLRAVKSYLDNLLLRIMETNPSLLSSTP